MRVVLPKSVGRELEVNHGYVSIDEEGYDQSAIASAMFHLTNKLAWQHNKGLRPIADYFRRFKDIMGVGPGKIQRSNIDFLSNETKQFIRSNRLINGGFWKDNSMGSW